VVRDEPLAELTAAVEAAAAPRVLIVDDEEAVVLTLKGILELDRYEITEATSLTQALDLLGADYFDVVLTDLHMGDGDGAEVVKALRDQGVDTSAIVLTGYASVESVIGALRDGAYDYIIKPCDVVDLRATVARGIERCRLAAQLRRRMSDLEQANETIRALNLELEARIEQATAELREQIAAKDEFMSTVSHDLKSPLTFIKGMANLRRRRAVPTPQTESLIEALEQIEAGAGRMAQQLDELVDASRLEAGRPLALRRDPVDLVELVRKAVRQHQQTTDRHLLYVACQLDELVGQWDELRLGRVLDNLLDNAVKFSPRGGTIEVRVDREPGQAVLSVADRGEGIPAVDLPLIFERFRRGGNVQDRIPGTGIGLAGVRGIVELHQGTIAVESEVGAGTTFTIRLPVEAPPT
jgi:signal transduction histidine kinase